MATVLWIVGLRPGSDERAREILREPPVELDRTSLDRHLVFLGRREVALLFDGEHAERDAARLLESRSGWGALASLTTPGARSLDEIFRWERPPELDGLSFGPHPGPGDSDGGG